MMDAKARLGKIVEQGRCAYRSQPEKGLTEAITDALLAEGVTLPPQPAGPVTSEATIGAALDLFGALVKIGSAEKAMGETLDAIRDRYARDHGLLTPAEVERRARAWAKPYRGWMTWADALSDSLVAALTAPADTSAASTREAK